ncbi:Msl5258 protein [hydrothermal vent metagenome]|uniref:Msl5258 protein n=1 Tax=hydrothermal vent metagenome TaxID=652676 RepID=A0A1W1CY30_9ZZZZ
MNLNQKVIFSENIFAQLVDDEMVLLDMESENYFGLDETGTSIWNVIQEHEHLEEAFNVLLEYYDVAEEILKNDLFAFVEKLVDNGLAKVVEV